MTLVIDVPTADPKLRFSRYVDGIAEALLTGTPPRFTMGLFGPWGTGKSSVLLAVRNGIEARFSAGGRVPPPIVIFDAWRHANLDTESLVRALVRAIDAVARPETNNSKLAGLFRRIQSIEAQGLGFGFGLQIADAEDDGVINNQLSVYGKPGGRKSNAVEPDRVIVMIDDLDRCSPEAIVRVIESIHALTDVNGFVFLMALDREVLIRSLAQQYAITMDEARRFTEKIISIPFNIPPIKFESVDEASELVENWPEIQRMWFSGVDPVKIVTTFNDAMGANPRQVKRFINTYMLARYMDAGGSPTAPGDARELTLLMAATALQLAWPQAANDLLLLARDSSADETLDEVIEILASDKTEPWADFLRSVLGRDERSLDYARIAGMAQAVAVTSASGGENGIDMRLGQASETLRDLFEEVSDHCRRHEPIVERKTSQYHGYAIPGEGRRGLTFATVNLKPRAEKVIVLLALDPSAFTDLSFARDVSELGKHGVGDLELTIEPGDGADRLNTVLSLISKSHSEALARSHSRP